MFLGGLSVSAYEEQPRKTGRMPDHDTRLLKLGDISEAIQLLTRLPVRHSGTYRGAAAAWAYPVAGLLVGTFGAIVAAVTSDLPGAVSAGLVLFTMVFVTGALHEDGLADTADGLWGGKTATDRLAIMKDSRIGAFGVLALVFGLGLKWAAMSSIADNGSLWPVVLVVAAMSRMPMVVVMYILPNARTGGLSENTGRPGQKTTLVAIGIGLLIGFLAFGLSVIFLALLLVATTLTVTAIARSKIRGQTGDILGATQQVSEIAILLYVIT